VASTAHCSGGPHTGHTTRHDETGERERELVELVHQAEDVDDLSVRGVRLCRLSSSSKLDEQAT
jgi:hypothetical protein